MGIRESFRRKPKLGLIGGAVLVVIGVGAILAQVVGTRSSTRYRGADAFFTTDGGKTYFVDDASKVPPFQLNGAEVDRAYVYSCNGKPFVAYIERYTPAGQQAMAKIAAGPKTAMPDARLVMQASNNREVKRPGETKWRSGSDPILMRELMDPRCPDGSGTVPELMQP